MKHALICASLLAALIAADAASAQTRRPSPQPPPPAACRDPQYSTDYVPGVDAYGRPVAPADVPGAVDVEISTEVYARLQSRNRQLRDVGVDVRLKGLETLPPCLPSPPPAAPRR